jgi:predicted Zn-ribbon and HTH transcriptional regulator
MNASQALRGLRLVRRRRVPSSSTSEPSANAARRRQPTTPGQLIIPSIMARTTRRLSFDTRGLERGSSEEVSIGAYARRQRRRRVLVGVFGGALIVGALTLYSLLKPPGHAAQGDRYAVRVRCAMCGHIATVRVRFDQTFPMQCPKCKAPACQAMWQCRQCGHQFVPEQPGLPVSCPECGSDQVGSAVAP